MPPRLEFGGFQPQKDRSDPSSRIYRGRPFIPEGFSFMNSELEAFLYSNSSARLANAGICEAAQENWINRIALGRLPTVDKEGNPKHFVSFFEFEQYFEDEYYSKPRHKRIFTGRNQR